MPRNNTTTLSVNDLRSEAKSYQRDKNHNKKWANGVVPRSGIKCSHLPPFSTGCTECPGRPAHYIYGHRTMKADKMYQKKQSVQASTLARKTFRREVSDAMDGPLANVTDTSTDDDVYEASAAPLPTEADFMYNYDAPSGPNGGNAILSFAVTQAVQRFENNETDKLINKEYDVIDEAKEGYTADEDDDDFEMVEHSHLK